MSNSTVFPHLALKERRIILTGIIHGSIKTAIVQTIGKNKSTVGRKIRLHRTLTTVPPVPATAVPTGSAAGSTNTSTARRIPRWTTAPP